MHKVSALLIFLISATWASAAENPLAGTEWALVDITCKSGKPNLPRGVEVVWVQSFYQDGTYRLYETVIDNGHRFCDNVLYGSYLPKPGNQVEISTDRSPDRKMCEVDPFGAFLWDYELSQDGKALTLLGTDGATQGNCGAGDQVRFRFRKI